MEHLHWLLPLVEQYGYVGLFVIALLGVVAVPVSVEGVMAFFGYLASRGDVNLVLAWLCGFLGSWCGMMLGYVLGRYPGGALVGRFGQRLGLTEARLRRVRDAIGRSSGTFIVFGYFVPGVRHLTGFSAGLFRIPAGIFTVYAETGAAIWSGVCIAIGYFVGREGVHLIAHLHRRSLRVLVLAAAAAVVYLLIRAILKRFR